MKVLITGGNGFIGKALSIKFLKKDIELYIWKKLNNSNDYLNNNEIYCDLLLQDKVNKYIEDFKFDICIHCAGASSVQGSIENPSIDFSNNVLSTKNLLEAIRLYSPNTKFIYLSSAAVYGETNISPIKETDILNPISPYGYSKLCAELLIEQYAKIYNIKSTVLRIFSVYGPQMRKQVVYDIFNKFYDSSTNIVELFGTGQEKRDFIYIDELVKIILLIIDKNVTGVFNVASGNSISIKNLAEVIRNELGSSKSIEFKGEGRKGDPIKWDVDISKLRDMGYRPTINIDEGIKLYHEWFKQQQ